MYENLFWLYATFTRSCSFASLFIGIGFLRPGFQLCASALLLCCYCALAVVIIVTIVKCRSTFWPSIPRHKYEQKRKKKKRKRSSERANEKESEKEKKPFHFTVPLESMLFGYAYINTKSAYLLWMGMKKIDRQTVNRKEIRRKKKDSSEKGIKAESEAQSNGTD